MKGISKKIFISLISTFRDSGKLIYDLATPLQRELLSFEKQGYLKEIGWIHSRLTQEPRDEKHAPVPWITYSAIQLLKEKLQYCGNITVLEFGSGNSTLYFANFNYMVRTIEHDQQWFNKMKDKLSSYKNVDLRFKELVYGGDYSRPDDDFRFDLVVVDGRDRVNCAINSYPNLKDNGILILDDSERNQYQPALDFYLQKGFKRLDFWGIAPGVFYNKSTTLLYRPDNIFKI